MENQGRALITGASAGIGAEIAREFARRGHPLVLVARSEDKLEALAAELRRTGVDVICLPCDLARKKAARSLQRTLAERAVDIDILVNNAGVTYAGAFMDMSPDYLADMLQLNVATLSTLTRLLAEPMLQRGYGRILNVSSLSAFQPVPMLAAYAASKAYVLSLSEALAEELRGTGVRVAALCPGLTNTEMAHQLDHLGGGIVQIPEFMLADVRSVARIGVDVCLSGQTVKVPGIANQLSALWSSTQPRWLVRSLAGMVGRRLGGD